MLKPKEKINYYSKDIEYQKQFNQRFFLMILVVVILFSLILVQLFSLQVLKNEEYEKKLIDFTLSTQLMSSPRGEIIDRNGETLVTNQERLAIIYFPPLNITNSQEWEMAYEFAKDFEVDISGLRLRDLKDIYLYNFPKEADKLITESEWDQYPSKLSDNDIYQRKISRITEDHVAQLDQLTIKAYQVKQAMNQSPRVSIKIIKDAVTVDEVAFLVANSQKYRGFDIHIYFDRSYPFGDTARGVFGSVTSTRQGLLSERLDYYLALGYMRNSSMGRSALELQYEFVLKGQDTQYKVNYKEDGLAQLDEIYQGQKGQNLRLAMDINLQQDVEAIVTQIMEREANNDFRKNMKTVYVVVSNPNNGDILALAGMKRGETTIYNNPVATYTESLAAGSTVKGATMYLGLSQELVKYNEFMIDEPIKIANDPIKKSLNNLGRVNDLMALSKSSNVYMFHIAMRLGGGRYEYNKPLSIDLAAFDVMRNTFSQFGLGTLTGIDVPNEAIGFMGNSSLGGHLLDYAIGQYDTYTIMQLSQYINTIANGGTRYRPRLVLDATLPDSSQLSYQNPVTPLNVLEDSKAIQRVQDGFRLCVLDGTCRGLSGIGVDVAAKTGTAEALLLDENGESYDSPNTLLVSYAPFDKPEISIACGIPNAWNDKSQSNLCVEITAEIYRAYFGLNSQTDEVQN